MGVKQTFQKMESKFIPFTLKLLKLHVKRWGVSKNAGFP